MYDESGYFDPNPIHGSLVDDPSQPSINCNNNNGSFSLEDLSNPNNPSSMVLDQLPHHLGFDIEQELQSQLIQDIHPMDHHNWDPNIQEARIHHQQQLQYDEQNLLSLFYLPRCPVAPLLPSTPAISFTGQRPMNFPMDVFSELPVDGGSVLYDPSTQSGHTNPQPHLLRDLFHSLPQSYGLFCGMDDGEEAAEASTIGGGMGVGGIFPEEDGRQFQNTLFDFKRKMKGDQGKTNFATEKHRREQLNEKYNALKSLVPNPSKNDRASIVADAIDYIEELKRTITELTILSDKKKCERNKKLKTDDGIAESSILGPLKDDTDHPFSKSIRSSWLQRRSKEAFVDVRIIDDEVNIKLTQRKKPNCLLLVSKVIDELELNPIHVSGANIGDTYIFMFNTKISEGSSVYASGIAMKLLEVMDSPHQSSHSNLSGFEK